jgi:NDP-4-keto-2,6-dideoxyhexose 3-C-methyltransferase
MYLDIDRCRSCGSSNLIDAFSLGCLALTGRFPGGEHEQISAGPLDLILCNNCKLVQLRHNFDLDALYGHEYGYRSGLNETMRKHLAELVIDAKSRVDLLTSDIVLDIGSNDATLLKSYDDDKLCRWGVDPTIEQFKEFYPDEINTIPRIFEPQDFLDAAGEKAKIITSVAMFYDLVDPNAFVSGIANCLRSDGVWVLEQSYLPTMIEKNSYDTICHEHLAYYGLLQLSTLFQRHELKIIDVVLNDANGGSFRVYVSHADAPFHVSPEVDKRIRWERSIGHEGIEPLRAFEQRIGKHREELLEILTKLRSNGKSVYVYGASTKGNTLLQYCGIDQSIVTAAADRNPKKWGKRTPGTNIPIISEIDARRERPDYFLVLPWHFREAFLAREASYLAEGGRMIFPLPELNIV